MTNVVDSLLRFVNDPVFHRPRKVIGTRTGAKQVNAVSVRQSDGSSLRS